MSLSRKNVQRFLIKPYEEPTRDQLLGPVLSLSVDATLYLDFKIEMLAEQSLTAASSSMDTSVLKEMKGQVGRVSSALRDYFERFWNLDNEGKKTAEVDLSEDTQDDEKFQIVGKNEDAGKKPLPCQFCDKPFANNCAICNQCTVCAKCIRTRRLLKSHMRCHHVE